MPSPPTPTTFKSRTPYLFIGALTAAAGAITYRLRPSTTPLRRFIPTASARPITSPNMFGAGKGVEVPAEGTPTAAIVFLHGLGDSGSGWAPFFPIPDHPHIRTLLPSAASHPVSLNAGFSSPSWFDLHTLSEDGPDDERGILESVDRVNTVIDGIVSTGIPSHRILLGGFSQGGALALTTALRSSRKLAGVIALSAWLPLRGHYPARATNEGKDVEMFVSHGTADPVVMFKFGRKSAEFLQSLDRRVIFKAYPGLTHSASPEVLEDVRQFVARVLPPM